MLINDLTETMHRKSKEIVAIYEDVDKSFKQENDICAGNIVHSKPDTRFTDERDNDRNAVDAT